MTRQVLGSVAGAILAVDVDRTGKWTSVVLDTSNAKKRVRVRYDVRGFERTILSREGTLTKIDTIKSTDSLSRTTELVRRPDDGLVVEVEISPGWTLVEV